MKFVFAKKHNIFHWLIVVLIRITIFLITSPISIYIAGIGFIIFKKTIEPFPISIFYDNLAYYILQLPYAVEIWKFMIEQNQLYKNAPTWWAMTIGMPLILIGSSIFLINFFNFIFSIFSLHYNRTHCPFCKEPIKIKH